jgi:hypothetical protein
LLGQPPRTLWRVYRWIIPLPAVFCGRSGSVAAHVGANVRQLIDNELAFITLHRLKRLESASQIRGNGLELNGKRLELG